MPEKVKLHKILIVDDAEINRKILAKIFCEDYDTVEAENGQKALDILASEQITVVLLDLNMPVMDGFEVLKAIQASERMRQVPVVIITSSDDDESQMKAFEAGAIDLINKPFNRQLVQCRVRNIISRSELLKVSQENKLFALQLRQQEELIRLSDVDDKTGIFNKRAFCRNTAQMLKDNPDKRFLIQRWDIDRFKIFNDAYGTETGDQLLKAIGQAYEKNAKNYALYTYAHLEADHFVCCLPKEIYNADGMLQKINQLLRTLFPSFEFVVRIGIFEILDPEMDVALMLDRAFLALRSIKGSYQDHIAQYDDAMRTALLDEQEIMGNMLSALLSGQFVLQYQPQYDYSTGALYGAEALVRWAHPQKGMISPGVFIPIFEKSGFILRLDEYVWEQTCVYLRQCLDKGIPVVPISVNISRRDIYNFELCSFIVSLTEKYHINHSLLRLEITESAYMDNPAQLIKVVEELRANGFVVEMDDFGSGYSSLNTLKDVPVDVLKLDMKFLDNSGNGERGGSILSAIIRMAHWLKLPVIAEGVETKEQADYLNSMNCSFMQGYYFSKPLPEAKFEQLLKESIHYIETNRFNSDIKGAVDFLNSSTQATLLFNSFVGGAAIISYNGSNVEALRMNDKFFETIGTTRRDYNLKQLRLLDRFEPESRANYVRMLEKAIETSSEAESECLSKPIKKGTPLIWTHTHARFLAQNAGEYVFYVTVENITERKSLLLKNEQLNNRLTALMANVPGGIMYFEIGDDIRLKFFNDRLPAMFGYSKEEFAEATSENMYALVHPDDVPHLKLETREILRQGHKHLNTRFRHRCKNNDWRYVQFSSRIMENKDGVVLASAILLDIDAQVNNELLNAAQAAQLDKQRLYLQALYNVLPCGIMQYKLENGQRFLMNYNEMSWRLFGYDSEMSYLSEVTGKSKVKDTFSADLPLVEENIRRICQQDTPIDFEHRILCKNGSVRWVHTILQKIKAKDGTEVIQSVFSDITDQKEISLLRYGRSFLLSCAVLYECDMESGLSVLKKTEQAFAYEGVEAPKSIPIAQQIDILCEEYIAPKDAKRMRTFLLFDAPLSDNSMHKTVCKMRDASGRYRLVQVTILHAEGTKYLLCFREAPDALKPQKGDGETERNVIPDTIRDPDMPFEFLENLPVGKAAFLMDNGQFIPLYADQKACALFGYTQAEYKKLIAARMPVRFTPSEGDVSSDAIQRLAAGESVAMRLRIPSRSQTERMIAVSCAAVKRDGQSICYVAVMNAQDILRREEKRKEMDERNRLINENLNELIFDYSPKEDTLWFSSTRPHEGTKEYTLAQYLMQFDKTTSIHKNSREDFKHAAEKALSAPGTGTVDFLINLSGKSMHWHRAHYVSMADAKGVVCRIVGRVDDVHHEVKEHDVMRVKAHMDGVTGLMNKDTAYEMIQSIMKKKPADRLDCMMVIDVDNFKHVNDQLGHIEGDKALKQVACKIREIFRQEDVVARFGGDEFLVYMRGVGDAEIASDKANKIVEALDGLPMKNDVKVTCSIGIVQIACAREGFDAFFAKADSAMYASKKAGKNRYTVFDPKKDESNSSL